MHENFSWVKFLRQKNWKFKFNCFTDSYQVHIKLASFCNRNCMGELPPSPVGGERETLVLDHGKEKEALHIQTTLSEERFNQDGGLEDSLVVGPL